MKLYKSINKSNINIIFIIFVIVLYDHYVLNGLEKIFCEVFLNYNFIKRPNLICNKKKNDFVKCVGMPSGHAQTITIFALLLYNYKMIALPVCILLILSVSLQRVISNAHTFLQIIIGILLGLFYSYIYISNNLTPICVFYIMLITLILIFTVMYKIEVEIYKPIPDWVDTNMITSIQKKQKSPFLLKFASIFVNSVIQGRTFIDWHMLEDYLDILIAEIKETNIQFDGIVGIKTGGAIISDYISKKLQLPNYKIKISRSEYNCDKKPVDTINDIYQKHLLDNLGEYTVCEGINKNIQGKNIILVDEMITTGKTMSESIRYLKNEKKTNIICPVCISFSQKRFIFDYNALHILNDIVCIWPWGYDN